ncbi:MAG TPA: pentapeptide repeat-containing protein [Candidatus Dormibacteraeota bacterium]|nr:pentapeptide repeat-containing protein [Candidatus Dormibacteraeota bacterium]
MLAEFEKSETEELLSNEQQEISLLDLAETLDQHKEWLESGGESGRRADFSGMNFAQADFTGVSLQGAILDRANLQGADLSMANFRGASLVQANLSEANLLGTEFHSANLMGATLYGAEGLWAGRLGGTNLFDAVLPESVAAFDGAKGLMQSSKRTQRIYVAMLSLSAVCAVLILLTSDLRLLLDSSAIPVIHFGNILPMSGFYLGAPLLLFLLYLRFHFLLLRLWGTLAELPSVFADGQTAEKGGPWFLVGLIRLHSKWPKESRSPLLVLETFLAAVLVYWAVPMVLFLFWARYLVRQDFRGTLLHVLMVTAAVGGATGLPFLVSRLLRQAELRRKKAKNLVRMVLKSLRASFATGIALLLLSIGVIHGLPAEKSVHPEVAQASMRRWASEFLQSTGYRPYAEITEASFIPPSARETLKSGEFDAVPGPKLNLENFRYARGYRTVLVNARLWRANLEGICLSESDLRGANLRESVLRSAALDRMRAEKANFVSADARGANFAAADLRESDFSYANLENTNFSGAKLNSASLYGANLQHAILLRADLSHADLRDVKLENANLALSLLQDTDLSAAKLAGADLTGARLKGTILLDTDLSHTDLRGASLEGAILRGAHMNGANLDGVDLRAAVGLTAGQVCSAANGKHAVLDPLFRLEVESYCGAPVVAASK